MLLLTAKVALIKLNEEKERGPCWMQYLYECVCDRGPGQQWTFVGWWRCCVHAAIHDSRMRNSHPHTHKYTRQATAATARRSVEMDGMKETNGNVCTPKIFNWVANRRCSTSWKIQRLLFVCVCVPGRQACWSSYTTAATAVCAQTLHTHRNTLANEISNMQRASACVVQAISTHNARTLRWFNITCCVCVLLWSYHQTVSNFGSVGLLIIYYFFIHFVYSQRTI